MTALALLLCVPVTMWLVQSALLRAAGLPIRWTIDAGDAPRFVRTGGRMTTQISLVGVIIAYPLMIGETPFAYYQGLLPATSAARAFPHGAAAAVLCLSVLYLAWIAAGSVEVRIHQSRRRWMRRLLLLVPTACFGALVEELLFRGVLMADLLRGQAWRAGSAVAITSLVFAAAHYVRSVKRRWTIFGHIMLGFTLSIAFLRTRTLWLPTGLHAGGILLIMGMRPFIRYRGPTWLTGASIYPFAGAAGLAGLGILTTFVWHYYHAGPSASTGPLMP
jgi:membrane protease YdiL (CAAX protease family)